MYGTFKVLAIFHFMLYGVMCFVYAPRLLVGFMQYGCMEAGMTHRNCTPVQAGGESLLLSEGTYVIFLRPVDV
jgi:hypothetical protein